jgi:hypothetical protein
VKQPKKVTVWLLYSSTCFSQSFNVFTTDLQFLIYHLYMHIFLFSNSSIKAVSHLTDKMK